MGLPTPVYRYDKRAEQWKEAPPDAVVAETVQTDRLVVVSFNVLFDLYHGLTDLIHTHKRTPYALNMLRELDADIIGLQAQPPFPPVKPRRASAPLTSASSSPRRRSRLRS
jgi:hypothetical protein